MTLMKTLAVTTALIVGASSFALAQNGPPTGGNAPVAGGSGNAAAPGTSGKTSTHKMSKHKKKQTPPS